MAKNNATQIASDESVKWGLIASSVATVLQTAIRWAGGVGIAYFGYLSITALAGQNTSANIALEFLGKLTTSNVLGWGVGVTGAIYGVNQRRLRGTSTERLQTRVIELEKILDSGRSSSKLTPRGNTNPKDKK